MFLCKYGWFSIFVFEVCGIIDFYEEFYRISEYRREKEIWEYVKLILWESKGRGEIEIGLWGRGLRKSLM